MAENELTRDEVDVIRAMADNDLNGSGGKRIVCRQKHH